MNYYLHRVLFKVGFFKKVNTKLKGIINRQRFSLPVIHEAGYHNVTISEPWFLKLFEDLFAVRKGTMVDVGMNVGQTLLKTASIERNRKYVGFEPNPLCYYVCRQLIKENQLEQYNIYPTGLFDKSGILTLYIDKDYSSGASVLKDFRKNMKRFKEQLNIPVFRGDELSAFNDETEIAVLKADVEGAELEVVKGLQNTIERTHPFLVLEILPVYDVTVPNGQYRKKRQDEMLETLTRLGYNCFWIDESNCTLLPLTEIPLHGDMNKTNYLFVHDNEISLLKKFKNFMVIG